MNGRNLSPQSSAEDVAEAVRANPLWYHTMELRPGVITPGWFDLRPIVDRLPWPEIAGKRCLDIGTYDGFLAFELERRGAAEVVAIDISDHTDWDWPVLLREQGPERLALFAGEKGGGFEIAARAIGSRVTKIETSVYDLDPNLIGQFDVVVCGSLLLHLRDPLRALEAIRNVCAGKFLSLEQVDAGLTLSHPRKPIFQLDGVDSRLQWLVPNVTGHRRMIAAAGFRIHQKTRPYAVPFGRAHPPAARRFKLVRRTIAGLWIAGSRGVPHSAILSVPE